MRQPSKGLAVIERGGARHWPASTAGARAVAAAGARFAEALHDEFPGETEWRIRQAFGVDVDTVHAWLTGGLPALPVLQAIIRRQGPDFGRRVFPPQDPDLWHRWFRLAKAVGAHRQRVGWYRHMVDELDDHAAELIQASPGYVFTLGFLGLWYRRCTIRIDLLVMRFNLWQSEKSLDFIFRRLVERGVIAATGETRQAPG